MKRLFILIIVSLLGGTFVLRDEYEQKINELENRIEMLENQNVIDDDLLNETIIRYSEHYSMEVILENGYIKSVEVCALFNTECEQKYYDDVDYNQFKETDRQYLIDEIDYELRMYEVLYEKYK